MIKAKGMCESLPININIFALILRHTVVGFVRVCQAPYREIRSQFCIFVLKECYSCVSRCDGNVIIE